MAIRDKIASKAQPHLQPGEQIQAVFAAQTHSQWIILIGVIPFLIVNKYRCFVVTDRRIAVFDSGKLAMAAPKQIVYELPRGTRLGPGRSLWYKFTPGPETLRVHTRFHKDIALADQYLPPQQAQQGYGPPQQGYGPPPQQGYGPPQQGYGPPPGYPPA